MPRIAWPMVIVTSTLALAACAPGDVEINGKLFDAVGLGTSSLQKSKTPVLPERAPLLVPPSLEKLPAPEQANAGQAAQDAAFPIDPEKRSSISQSELQRQQDEYCKVHYDRPKALGDSVTASTAKGPLGLCGGSVLSAIGNNPLTSLQGK